MGRLGRLVERLDDVRRQLLQPVPVARQPLAESDRARARTPRAVKPRLEHRLREPDVGGHAEALVDRPPLLEEHPVSLGVRPDEVAARGVVQDRPHRLLEDGRHLIALRVEPRRQAVSVEQVGERRIFPLRAGLPVALGRKHHEQAPVHRAAIRDVPVRNREDVLPELVAGPVSDDGSRVLVLAGHHELVRLPRARIDGRRRLRASAGRGGVEPDRRYGGHGQKGNRSCHCVVCRHDSRLRWPRDGWSQNRTRVRRNQKRCPCFYAHAWQPS